METNSLIWTKEKPVKAGWYWFREIGDIVSIVKVREDKGILYTQSSVWYAPFMVRDSGGEWAGPIPEPREASVSVTELRRRVHAAVLRQRRSKTGQAKAMESEAV